MSDDEGARYRHASDVKRWLALAVLIGGFVLTFFDTSLRYQTAIVSAVLLLFISAQDDRVRALRCEVRDLQTKAAAEHTKIPDPVAAVDLPNGTRVRVVIEGTVESAASGSGGYLMLDDHDEGPYLRQCVSVVKVLSPGGAA